MVEANVEMDTVTNPICRICLQRCQGLILSLYDFFDSDSTVFEKIEECSGIKMILNANLPLNICTCCNSILNLVNKFRTICNNSNAYLIEYVYKSSSFSDNEIDPNDYIIECDNLDESKNHENDEEVMDKSGETNFVDTTETLFDEHNSEYTENEWFKEDNDLVKDTSSILDEIPIQEEILPKVISSSSMVQINTDNSAVINKICKTSSSNDKQVHICDICGNSYPRKYALISHMRRHRNERPFQCEICDQSFHLNFQLTRHIRKHTGARPFRCEYCHRNFADRSTMLKHERLHRNERPYSCETCGKSFTYASVLKVHQLTHTGQKPFYCGICSKRFSRAHHLRAHLETILHQDDPKSKELLKKIKKEEENVNTSLFNL